MKRQRVDKNARKGELEQLPEDIIQQILSNLERKEAIRVSVLCKTLYGALSLHPILKLHHDEVFSISKVRSYPGDKILVTEQVREQLVNYVNKTLKRYRRHNQIPQQLHLTMNCERYSSAFPMIKKLLQKFEEDGVRGIRVFYTSAEQPVRDVTNLFGVLECKALVEFNVERCRLLMKPEQIENGIEIRCRLLKRLILAYVCTDEETIQSIISACPLIEYLQLRDCLDLRRIKVVNHHCLKEIAIFNNHYSLEEIEVEIPNLESLVLESVCFVRGFNLYQCQNLKTLSLEHVLMDDSFFWDFASKFPNLENFSAISCDGYEEVNISSNSLKSLTLKSYSDKTQPQINAPNLVSFKYKSWEIPCFVSCIASSICECKLDLMMAFLLHQDSASLFIQLKETLKRIIKSKLSLSIYFYSIGNLENLEGSSNASSEPGVEVEDLTLYKQEDSTSSARTYSTFVDNLFWSCRPKSICLDRFADFDQEFAKVFCKRLMERRTNPDKLNSPESKIGSWENDLKGVKIEYDKEAQLVSVDDWRTLGEIRSQFIFSDLQQIYFRLEW